MMLKNADILNLLAEDVFLALGDDGVLHLGVVAPQLAGLLLGALHLPFFLALRLRLFGLSLLLLLELDRLGRLNLHDALGG